MAEVAPLLTRQGWELVTPAAASGAATGGAVGGVGGLALIGASVAALLLAFMAAKRAAGRASAAKGKTGAGKSPAGAGGKSPLGSLLGRTPRTGGGSGSSGRSSGAAGGSRAGGGRGRFGLPTRKGGGSGAGRGGASPAGSRTGSGSSPAGGSKKGSGRLAGLASRLTGRKSGRSAGSTGRKATGGGRTGSATTGRGGAASKSPGGSSSSGKPGLLGRARNLARANKLGRARARQAAGGGAGNRPAVHRAHRDSGAGIRAAARYLAGRGKPTAKPTSTRSPGPGTTPNAPTVPAGKPTTKRGRLAARLRRTPRAKRQRLNPATSAPGATPVARRAIAAATTPTGSRRRRTIGDEAMPIKRLGRRTINQTGMKASTHLGSAPASGKNPFAAVIEACGISAQGYHPENAERAIDWYEGMPTLIEAISAMFKAQGAKTTEEFYLYPAAGEFARALGDQFARYQAAIEAARHAFETAHAEDLERIRNPKPFQEGWDISKNRGVAS